MSFCDCAEPLLDLAWRAELVDFAPEPAEDLPAESFGTARFVDCDRVDVHPVTEGM